VGIRSKLLPAIAGSFVWLKPYGVVYAPLGIRERRPNTNVYRCIEICIIGVFAMPTKECCIGSQTLRTAEMASLGCVPSRNKFNPYSFPFCFIDGVFNYSTSYPVANSPIIHSGVFTFNRIQAFEIFHSNHAIIFFSGFNYSSANIVSNPIVYSPYTLPQSPNPFTCSLTFGKHRFKLIYAVPEHSDLCRSFLYFKNST